MRPAAVPAVGVLVSSDAGRTRAVRYGDATTG